MDSSSLSDPPLVRVKSLLDVLMNILTNTEKLGGQNLHKTPFNQGVITLNTI